MRIFRGTIVVLLALLLSAVSVHAEEEEVQEDDAVTDDAAADESYATQFEVCADSVIEVQGISILCDSPGTYYYGSGKHRNSDECQPGDKAKVQIEFYIADHDTIQQAGNYALVSIDVDSGWWSESKIVYENADLCSLSSLKSVSGKQCPYQGYYKINTQFYWTSTDSNSGSSFYPTVSVGFKSSLNVNVYDYGGANTNLCRGSTFVTWSDGVSVSYANAISNFMRSFGILLFTICVMGAFIWFLAKRPTSLADAKEKLVGRKKEPLNEDEFDFRKMRTAGKGDIVDF
jgi:hypothetical protein